MATLQAGLIPLSCHHKLHPYITPQIEFVKGHNQVFRNFFLKLTQLKRAGIIIYKKEYQMLVLSRKKDETILIKQPGQKPIRITVVNIDKNKIRLGIEADEAVSILRSELDENTLPQ